MSIIGKCQGLFNPLSRDLMMDNISRHVSMQTLGKLLLVDQIVIITKGFHLLSMYNFL